MKHLRIVLFVTFVFSLGGARAQQDHFLYLQTENGQPFYLKFEKKLFSSTATGYLLLSKLKAGTYELRIGFPKTEFPEQSFTATLADNDAGYLLKHFEGKGWGLFNLQTMALTMARDSTPPVAVEVTNKTDAFSTMLSSVVNDSSIRQVETVKEVVPKQPAADSSTAAMNAPAQDSSGAGTAAVLGHTSPGTAPVTSDKSPVATDSQGSGEQTGRKTEIAVTGTAVAGTIARSVVTRSMLIRNWDGMEMVYVDDLGDKKDTIRVYIPFPKPAKSQEQTATTVTRADSKLTSSGEQGGKQDAVVPSGGADKQEDLMIGERPEGKNKAKVDAAKEKFGRDDIAVDASGSGSAGEKQTPDKTVADPSGKSETPSSAPAQRAFMINSDCKNFASEEDFRKLRKKMASEDDPDDRLALARKAFRARCFTVQQVSNLAGLFEKDAGKYAFFDIAYPFVSDSHNFPALQSQLSDPYYINRFQSMIRH